MVRLKQETAPAHRAIEAHVDLPSRLASPAAYRAWLARLYGFHVEIERRLAAVDDVSALLRGRGKTQWLAADLLNLGLDQNALVALPRAIEAPHPRSVGEALGVMYVLEGATLGGAVIAKQVRRRLGYGPTCGARYFAGYGRETARKWKSFGLALKSIAQPDDEGVVIASAERTFAAMQAWL